MLSNQDAKACPECGEVYEQLSQHYARTDGHRPQLADSAIEVLTGILMGDGCIKQQKTTHPQMQILIVQPRYLQWLQN